MDVFVLAIVLLNKADDDTVDVGFEVNVLSGQDVEVFDIVADLVDVRVPVDVLVGILVLVY